MNSNGNPSMAMKYAEADSRAQGQAFRIVAGLVKIKIYRDHRSLALGVNN